MNDRGKRYDPPDYQNWTAGTGFAFDIVSQYLKKSEDKQEEMTVDRAVQDLRAMAASIFVDNGDYAKRLNAIADFLESITWIERES